MARTTKSDVIIPELWDEAVQGAFANKGAFMRSTMVASQAAVIRGDMPAGQADIGNEIKVPYFGIIGDFEDLNDGDAATPKRIRQNNEVATVARAALAFEPTRWARSSAGDDVYAEGARQMVEAALRKMDAELITKAKAPGVPKVDIFSAAAPAYLDYRALVEGRMLFGDEYDSDVAAIIVHSATAGRIMSQVDSKGRPLFVESVTAEGGQQYAGIPMVVSDRAPLDGSVMSAVVATGSTPPTVTLSGVPEGNWKLQIDIVVGGALGTATFRFSTDGGQTWSATIATAASVPLVDPADDSMIGNNGRTGITAAFASATYNADNLYVSNAVLKFTSMIVKRNSFAFWFNNDALRMQTDRDILADSDLAASHLYYAAHRYRRPRGMSKAGVVHIVHN